MNQLLGPLSRAIAFKFGRKYRHRGYACLKKFGLKFELQVEIYATYSLLVAIAYCTIITTDYMCMLKVIMGTFLTSARFIHKARYCVVCSTV